MPDVLLVTDADWIADECEAALGGPHVVHRIRRGADVLPAIDQVDPALVLLDLQIGNMGGMAACLAIRQEEGVGQGRGDEGRADWKEEKDPKGGDDVA